MGLETVALVMAAAAAAQKTMAGLKQRKEVARATDAARAANVTATQAAKTKEGERAARSRAGAKASVASRGMIGSVNDPNSILGLLVGDINKGSAENLRMIGERSQNIARDIAAKRAAGRAGANQMIGSGVGDLVKAGVSAAAGMPMFSSGVGASPTEAYQQAIEAGASPSEALDIGTNQGRANLIALSGGSR